MLLSVVTTLYNSENYVEEFYDRISKTLKEITDDYEIIMVNDGSPDSSYDKALNIADRDRQVKVINLSRNFGHHKAVMTGVRNSIGELVFLIDVDLEEPPELLGNFWGIINNEKDIDVVFGVQIVRKGKWFERISGNLFYWFLNFFSDVKIEKNLTTVRLMRRNYVDKLILYNEKELAFGGICAHAGFNQIPVKIEKGYKSVSSYSLKKKLDLTVNFVSSFSNKPLIFIFYLGLVITSISLVFIIYLLIIKMFYGVVLGWTSILISLWFIGGLIIFSLGVLGIYLSKIFIEVKNRPLTIIKSVYQEKKDD